MNVPARIADRLVPVPDTGCMLWEGSSDQKGYATIKWEGKTRRLNRVLFKLRTGRWPRRGWEMLHSCDTPACCAEGHVREGTRKKNAQERQERGRTRGLKQYRNSEHRRIYPIWTVRMPGHERRSA